MPTDLDLTSATAVIAGSTSFQVAPDGHVFGILRGVEGLQR
jgi:hypothetical protein